MSPRTARSLRTLFASSPLSRDVGLRLVSAGGGRAVVSLLVRRRHTQGLARTHGGVAALLADTAATFAAYSSLPEDEHLLTAGFSMSLTAGSRAGERLSAAGRILHAGGRLVVAEVQVRGRRGILVAAGTFTMMRMPAGKGPAR